MSLTRNRLITEASIIEIVITTDKEEQEVVQIITQTEIQARTILIILVHKERVAIVITTLRRLITQRQIPTEAITVLGTGRIIILLQTVATVPVLHHGEVLRVVQVVAAAVAAEAVLVAHVVHVKT